MVEAQLKHKHEKRREKPTSVDKSERNRIWILSFTNLICAGIGKRMSFSTLQRNLLSVRCSSTLILVQGAASSANPLDQRVHCNTADCKALVSQFPCHRHLSLLKGLWAATCQHLQSPHPGLMLMMLRGVSGSKPAGEG